MIVHPLDPSTDPHDEIRTDLWDEMTLTQLHRQQELMIDRLNQLFGLRSSMNSNSPTVLSMYHITFAAYERLNALVEYKSGGNVNA